MMQESLALSFELLGHYRHYSIKRKTWRLLGRQIEIRGKKGVDSQARKKSGGKNGLGMARE